MKSIRFRNEILLAVKIIIPAAGILFFHWSIGAIFFYYCLELLFIGAETVLRIFIAAQSPVGQKIVGLFRFLLIYAFMVLFIVVLMGHFFNGGASGNMEAHFEKEAVWLLAGLYLFDLVFGFLLSGRFRTATVKSVEQETYRLLGLSFVLLAIFLLVMNAFVDTSQTNYVLGIAIIVARNGVEYLIQKGVK